MSGGRIISGFVRGVPQEYLALSIPLGEARDRLNEAWDLIIRAEAIELFARTVLPELKRG